MMWRCRQARPAASCTHDATEAARLPHAARELQGHASAQPLRVFWLASRPERCSLSPPPLPRLQVAQHPPDMPAEAWVAVLMASNVLRVAICGMLCCAAAR